MLCFFTSGCVLLHVVLSQAWHWHADVVRRALHTHNVEGIVMLLNLRASQLYRLWHATAGGRLAPKTHQGPRGPG